MPSSPAELAPLWDDLRAPRALVARAGSRARAGEVTLALVDLDAARGDWGALDDLHRSALLATAIDCRLARGELGPAMDDGEALEPLLDRANLAGACAHYARGELAAALGDAELAADHHLRSGRLLAGADDPHLLPWRAAAALSAVRLGRRTQALELAREHLVLARAAGSAYSTALGLRTLATVDMHTDQDRTLRDARTVLVTTPAARLAAQLDTDLAGVLLLARGTEGSVEALALLRGAEEYAGREQLYPLQSRIRRLLERLGEPARPMLAEALAALTASEARVATLAAGGLTNREIAMQLVVTVKAVEWHLSRVYRKLGIRSRSGLAGSLGLA
ncbi:LuxR C-terminal-related transcriptional regulator [Nocardioides sp.]|uniref:LuxR C-terminal-related transcriptional regulator n=1 Tax=Nocardioides sp. TaxID=35761 RepID=UPI0037843C07